MKSAIYRGRVRHRRFAPAQHQFQYRVFMMYLDLAELPELFDRYWLWSARRFAPAWFRRSDYHGNGRTCVDKSIRDLVAERTKRRPAGPIRLLTHLRYFGYTFNPISLYYCFDEEDSRIDTIVAEVSNTPWGERHSYVLPAAASEARRPFMRFSTRKEIHVSPFMPMNLTHEWRMNEPTERLWLHIQNRMQEERLFDATLSLEREEINSRNLARALTSYPFMTARVTAAIHWQALRLWLKGVPVHTHPAKLAATLKQES